MSYCSQQDMVDRFGEEELIQLTDRANTGSIDAAVLASAILDADAEIDGYLAGRYALPLSSVPLVLRRIACNLVRYSLYGAGMIDVVQVKYDSSIRTLKSIGKGEIDLGLTQTGAQAASAGSAQMESGGRIFGRDAGGYL